MKNAVNRVSFTIANKNKKKYCLKKLLEGHLKLNIPGIEIALEKIIQSQNNSKNI